MRGDAPYATGQEQGVSYAVDFADRAGDSELAVSWRELQIVMARNDRQIDSALGDQDSPYWTF